jgi:TonB-dependent SusC/RagA subfamily outer membrane receptor
MTSHVARILFAAGLSILALGCGSSQRTSEPAPSRSSDPDEVTSEEIARAPGQSIEEHLRGRVAGVTVTRSPDGGIAVRIRGGTSVYGSNEPLYVLDGVVITPGPGGSLSGIDPYDIESIKVLKDPADTAMYGMRGANGVILIKTKRPTRSKNPSN